MRSVRAVFVVYLTVIVLGIVYFICAGTDGPMSERSRGFLRDNALSLVFGAMFLLTLVGQAISGTADYNAQQVVNGLEPVTLLEYVTSSSFGVDVMENWQSEYLQFFLYIFGTVWLIQRGSAESKKPGEEGPESDKEQRIGRHAQDGLTRRGPAPAAGARPSSPARSGCSWAGCSCSPGPPPRSPDGPRSTASSWASGRTR